MKVNFSHLETKEEDDPLVVVMVGPFFLDYFVGIERGADQGRCYGLTNFPKKTILFIIYFIFFHETLKNM